MKTFFKYQSQIKSYEVSRAIAAPIGFGPLCGYDDFEAEISSQQLSSFTLKVSDSQNSYLPASIVSYIKSLHDSKAIIYDANNATLDSNKVLHSCITRDGYLHIHEDSEIDIVPMNGTVMNPNRYAVAVFAVHPSGDGTVVYSEILYYVAIPLNFDSNYGSSTVGTNLKNMYQRSINPQTTNDLGETVDIDPYDIGQFSYESLAGLINVGIPSSISISNDMRDYTLIGVYGAFPNDDGTANTKFSIIPYNSVWPNPLPFTLPVYQSIKNLFTLDNLYNVLKDKLNTLISKALEEAITAEKLTSKLDSYYKIESGCIMLWSGTVDTIPNGWSEYTAAQGKVVIGYKSGGVTINSGTVLANPTNIYEGVWSLTLTNEQLPPHRHALYVGGVAEENAKGVTYYGLVGFRSTPSDWSDSLNSTKHSPAATANTITSNGKSYDVTSLQITDTSINASSVNSITERTQASSINLLPPSITLIYIIKN